jgi:hypothetical protein
VVEPGIHQVRWVIAWYPALFVITTVTISNVTVPRHHVVADTRPLVGQPDYETDNHNSYRIKRPSDTITTHRTPPEIRV